MVSELGEGVSTAEIAIDDRLWSEAVAFTRGRSPGSFDQWFSGIQFDGLTDGVLGLRARNEFVREWVDQHFLPTITDFIRSKTGWSVQVAWTVGGDVQRPVSEPTQDAAAQSGARPVRPKTLSVGDQPPQSTRAQAAPPVEGLNPKYTFSNFVVGSSNQLAHAACMAAAGGGGPRHNPVF